MISETKKYLQFIFPFFNTKRTKEIFRVNPTVLPVREEAAEIFIYVYDYDRYDIKEYQLDNVADAFSCRDNNKISWINIDGIRKADVESICKHFGVHYLLVEDILSIGQRPKMDEIDNVLFCLLNMLYFNDEYKTVEQEQISIVLGKDFVISFQEDEKRDVFTPLRDRLRMSGSKIRQRGADYLCYAMLDLIVDNYFIVMEKLGDQIEAVEEEVIRGNQRKSLAKINLLRKELIILKRNFFSSHENKFN